MSEFKDYLRKYAEKELQLIGLLDTEFGKSTLKFLDNLADITDNDPESMKKVADILFRLIDRKPLSPITEEDFESPKNTETQNEILQCTRYPYVYKKGGKYWDDRAVVFRTNDAHPNDRTYLYQSNNSSKQEIELPYYPTETVKFL